MPKNKYNSIECVQSFPDFSQWNDTSEYVPISDTQGKFRYFRTQWIKPRQKNDRTGSYICANPSSNLCLKSFDQRQILDQIKKNKQHAQIQKLKGRLDMNQFTQVTEFIIHSQLCHCRPKNTGNNDNDETMQLMSMKVAKYSSNNMNDYFTREPPHKRRSSNENARDGSDGNSNDNINDINKNSQKQAESHAAGWSNIDDTLDEDEKAEVLSDEDVLNEADMPTCKPNSHNDKNLNDNVDEVGDNNVLEYDGNIGIINHDSNGNSNRDANFSVSGNDNDKMNQGIRNGILNGINHPINGGINSCINNDINDSIGIINNINNDINIDIGNGMKGIDHGISINNDDRCADSNNNYNISNSINNRINGNNVNINDINQSAQKHFISTDSALENQKQKRDN